MESSASPGKRRLDMAARDHLRTIEKDVRKIVDELQECRTTIGRMDTALEDLRKFGFSLITGLLTASALVGGLASNARLALPVAGFVVMILVTALFGIDMYYQALLSSAVERAMDLEFISTNPAIKITTTISRNAMAIHAY